MVDSRAARKLGMTYEEYLAFEEKAETKHEFIDGAVVEMTGGAIDHARLIARMGFVLSSAVEGKPCVVLSSYARVRIAVSNRATYPDLSVVCKQIAVASDDPNGLVNPTVLVEVLSDGTESYDRGEKFRQYRHLESLREYVLVAQHEPRIEVFRREGTSWRLEEYGPGETVDLPSIDARISVDQVYLDPLAAH